MIIDKSMALSCQFSQRTSYNGDPGGREEGTFQCSNSSFALPCAILPVTASVQKTKVVYSSWISPSLPVWAIWMAASPQMNGQIASLAALLWAASVPWGRKGSWSPSRAFPWQVWGFPWQVWGSDIQSLLCKQIVQQIPVVQGCIPHSSMSLCC